MSSVNKDNKDDTETEASEEPGYAVQQEFGPLLAKLEARAAAQKRAGVSSMIAEELAFLSHQSQQYLLNSASSDALRKQVEEAKERELARAKQMDVLVPLTYSTIDSDHADIGEVVPLPETGNLVKVVDTNFTKHNVIIDAHQERWVKGKKKVAKAVEDASANRFEIDLLGEREEEDDEYGTNEARSNFKLIRALCSDHPNSPYSKKNRKKHRKQGENDDQPEFSTASDSEDEETLGKNAIEQATLSLAKTSTKNDEFMFQWDLDHDAGGANYVKELHEARQTIERMKEQNERRLGETKLAAELQIKAYQASHAEAILLSKNEVEQLKKEIQEKSNENRKLQLEMFDKCYEKDAKIKEMGDRLEEEITERMEAEKEHQTQIIQLNSDVQCLQQELQDEKHTVEEKLKVVANLQNEMKNEKESFEKQIHEAKVVREGLQQDIQRCETEAKISEKGKQNLEEKMLALQSEVEKVQEEVEKSKEESQHLISTRDEFEKSVWTNFEGEVEILKHQNETLKAEQGDVILENRNLQTQIQSLTQNLKDVEQQKKQMKGVMLELGKTQKSLLQFQSQNEALKTRRMTLLCENVIFRAKILSLEKRNVLQERIDALTAQNRWLTSEMNKLQIRRKKLNPSFIIRKIPRFAGDAEDSGEEEEKMILYEKDVGLQATPGDIQKTYQPLLGFKDKSVDAITQTYETSFTSQRSASPAVNQYMSSTGQVPLGIADQVSRYVETINQQYTADRQKHIFGTSAGGGMLKGGCYPMTTCRTGEDGHEQSTPRIREVFDDPLEVPDPHLREVHLVTNLTGNNATTKPPTSQSASRAGSASQSRTVKAKGKQRPMSAATTTTSLSSLPRGVNRGKSEESSSSPALLNLEVLGTQGPEHAKLTSNPYDYFSVQRQQAGSASLPPGGYHLYTELPLDPSSEATTPWVPTQYAVGSLPTKIVVNNVPRGENMMATEIGERKGSSVEQCPSSSNGFGGFMATPSYPVGAWRPMKKDPY